MFKTKFNTIKIKEQDNPKDIYPMKQVMCDSNNEKVKQMKEKEKQKEKNEKNKNDKNNSEEKKEEQKLIKGGPIIRICASKQCPRNQRGLCANNECSCHKNHKQCNQFLNSHYIRTLLSDYKRQNQDFVNTLLNTLKSLAEKIIGLHNSIVKEYSEVVYPPEYIKDFGTTANKDIAVKLAKLFNDTPRFSIPVLKTKSVEYLSFNQIFKESVDLTMQGIAKIKEMVQTLPTFKKKLVSQIFRINDQRVKQMQENIIKGLRDDS